MSKHSEAMLLALHRVVIAEKMRNPTGPKVTREEAVAARPSVRISARVWLAALDAELVARSDGRPGAPMVITDAGRAILSASVAVACPKAVGR